MIQLDSGKFRMAVAGFADRLGVGMGDLVTRMCQSLATTTNKLQHKQLDRQTRGQLSRSVALKNSAEDLADSRRANLKPLVTLKDMVPDDDSFGSRCAWSVRDWCESVTGVYW